MESELEKHLKIGFYTATILDWKKLLKPEKYKDIVLGSLRFLAEQKRAKTYGFVIIPKFLGTSCPVILIYFGKSKKSGV